MESTAVAPIHSESEFNEIIFKYLQNVCSDLFKMHQGNPVFVLASINTALLMVLSAMHRGDKEKIADHIERLFPDLAENVRSAEIVPMAKLH